MLFYMTIAALFLFTVVMSAVIGFLMYQAVRRLTASRAARHTTGAAAVLLASYVMTRVLLFPTWYYYAAVLVVSIALYTVLLKSSLERTDS